jgi:hypothetical protein
MNDLQSGVYEAVNAILSTIARPAYTRVESELGELTTEMDK